MGKEISDLLNDDIIRANLSKFSDLGLDKHYDFEVDPECTVKNYEEFSAFVKANEPLVFTISEDNTLYYKIDGEDAEIVFDIDVTSSFSKSDQWLSDKLIKVNELFPTISSISISEEQTSCYVCLCIASVFKDVFIEEILEVADSYDFTKWRPKDDDGISFLDLSINWIQIGSKYVKMVAAAAKYTLLREKQKKTVPSALQLPEGVVSKLNKVLRDIDTVRYEYDNIKLSPQVRSQLSKLDIKVIIRERDNKIEGLLKEDSSIYQIYRLMNLNSNVIPPTILLRIYREARKSALSFFCDMNPGTDKPKAYEDRLELKKVEDKFKRTVRRAYLNKLFVRESEKFRQDPASYVAPNFV
jgi:hypothetical protein